MSALIHEGDSPPDVQERPRLNETAPTEKALTTSAESTPRRSSWPGCDRVRQRRAAARQLDVLLGVDRRPAVGGDR